jgi:DNA-binding NarL/FixJ family response regulator
MALRILVAARRESTRGRLARALEANGCVVCASCSTAKAAVEAAAMHRPRVCVIHLDLPGGGLTACRALTSRPRPPRVVVLAPSGRESDVAAAVRAGADGFVIDEIDPAPVPRAVLDVASGKPYLSAPAAERLLAELRKPNHRKGGST